MNNSIPRSYLCGGLLIAILLSTFSINTPADPVFREHIPDFYQHQKTGCTPADIVPIDCGRCADQPTYNNLAWLEPEGEGFCSGTVLANSLYYLEQTYGLRFFDLSHLGEHHQKRTWLDRMNYLVEDIFFSIFRSKHKRSKSISHYINQRFIENRLPADTTKDLRFLVHHYRHSDAEEPALQEAAGETEVIHRMKPDDSLYDVVLEKMLHTKQPVMIYLTSENRQYRWSYHALSVAGIEREKTNRRLWVADPHNTLYGDGRCYYYKEQDEFPAGKKHFQEIVIGDDGKTIIDGPYTDATIALVLTIEVAEKDEQKAGLSTNQ